MSFDPAIIFVNAGNLPHLLFGERFADGSVEIAPILLRTDGERNRNLSTLNSPFNTDHSWMNIQPLGNFHDNWILYINRVLRSLVSIRAAWRADRCETYWGNLIVNAKLEKLGLLKMRMEFHFISSGLDLCISQQQLQFCDGHIRGSNMSNQTHRY